VSDIAKKIMKIDIIKSNLIVKLTFEFSLEIVKYCELLEVKRRYIICNQLLRAATSIGANVWEAQNAESKPDFIHKFKIAAKEGDETLYWLLLCKYSLNYPDPSYLIDQLINIQMIINKIVSTTKRVYNNERN
jgi:four helix bundle protein